MEIVSPDRFTLNVFFPPTLLLYVYVRMLIETLENPGKPHNTDISRIPLKTRAFAADEAAMVCIYECDYSHLRLSFMSAVH